MTNRQIAASLVLCMLRSTRTAVKTTRVSTLAEIGNKKRMNQANADKIIEFGVKFLDPWIDRLKKLTTPKNAPGGSTIDSDEETMEDTKEASWDN